MGANPGQAFFQLLADDIGGACGAPCAGGALAGLLWTTVGNILWNVANSQGMLSKQQFQDGMDTARVVSAKHLLYLQARGDTTAAGALTTATAALNALESQGAALPATAPNALTAGAPQAALAGGGASSGNAAIDAAALEIVQAFLAIPPGQWQAFIQAQVQNTAA